ncbi:uncharacterized protein LOC135846829 [Planococcus citri]|uniref:uncharacterized protein LOC135843585 n=1 Tax=Planococcus citri TaxID=170843 RepID=UPI0031F8DD2C
MSDNETEFSKEKFVNEDDLLKSPSSNDNLSSEDKNDKSPGIHVGEIPSDGKKSPEQVPKKVLKYLRELSSLYSDLEEESTVVDSFTDSEVDQVINSVIETVDSLKIKYMEIHEKLKSHLEPGKSYDEAIANKKLFSDLHRSIKFKLLRLLKPAPQPVNSVSDSASSHIRVKFPKLELRTFRGKDDNWVDWSRMYCSMVHDKPNMLVYDKHQILRSKLVDEAEILVRGYPIKAENYEEVWKLLNETYGEPVKNIETFLKAIDSLDPVSKHDLDQSLRNLITNFRSNYTAINLTLKQHPEIDGMSLIFSYLFLKKVDKDTKVDWQREVARKKEYGSFEQFLTYQNERCGAMERGSDDTSRKRKHSPPPSSGKKKSFALSEKRQKLQPKKCGFCDGEHETFGCKIFIDKTPSDRLKMVKEKGRCFRCLKKFIPGHNRKCKYFCNVCKRGHNPLLHEAFTNEKTG